MSRKKMEFGGAADREHPVETACRMRGRTMEDLCGELGIAVIEMNVYTTGLRRPPEGFLDRIAKILDVDEIFLRGRGKTVSFFDGEETAICAVLAERKEERGTFMIAEKPDGTFLACMQEHGKLLMAPCPANAHASADLPADAWTDELGRGVSL